MKKILLTLCTCFILTSCIHNPFAPKVQTLPLVIPELSPVPLFVANNADGTIGEVADEEFGGEVSVSVGKLFTSASGQLCKNAVVGKKGAEAETIVICKNNDYWTLMPRIWARNF